MRSIQMIHSLLLGLVMALPAFAAQQPPKAERSTAQPTTETVPTKKGTVEPAPSASPTQKYKHSRGKQKTFPIPQPTPQLLMGVRRVDLKPVNSSATLNVALAVGSVVIIEFPANDRIYYIHPGDARFVAVDDQNSLAQSNILVLRPGTSFLSPQRPTNAPVASISTQTNSGLTVTFLVFPVQSPNESAHHLVLVYDPKEIAAERQRLGLLTNLYNQENNEKERKEKEKSQSVDPKTERNVTRPATSTEQQTPPPPTPPQVGVEVEVAPPNKHKKGELSEQKRIDAAARLLRQINAVVAQPTTKTNKSKLSISTSKIEFLDAATALIGCRLENNSSQTVVLSEAPPEIRLDTYDKNGRLTSSIPLPILWVERSASTATLAPRATISYAIVFQLPVVMPNQRLRVATMVRLPAEELLREIAK